MGLPDVDIYNIYTRKVLVRKDFPGTLTTTMIRRVDKFLSLTLDLFCIISWHNPDHAMRTGIISAQVKKSKKGPFHFEQNWFKFTEHVSI